MMGREETLRTRVYCVRTVERVVDALQEEYLTLLPEAIPFLAELQEDLEPYIEHITRKLTKKLSELSGEDLKTLMKDGFKPKPKEEANGDTNNNKDEDMSESDY
jgi:U3 small nucleolar RNA-associated protein 10